MNDHLQIFSTDRLAILALPRYKTNDVFSFISDLAIKDSIRVIDGGNLFNVLILSRIIRRRTDNIIEVLERIHLARAFTCIQMESMLQEVTIGNDPILILDLLHTFYDESVSDQQSQYLLGGCIRSLKQLSCVAPVLVHVFPSPKKEMRPFLVKMLFEATNNIWGLESKTNIPMQLPLWE